MSQHKIVYTLADTSSDTSSLLVKTRSNLIVSCHQRLHFVTTFTFDLILDKIPKSPTHSAAIT